MPGCGRRSPGCWTSLSVAGAGTIVVVELGFADPTVRESGRGRRMKTFRRTVAGIPTAQLRSRLTSMATRRGITVVAVDPRYTSKAGGKAWAAWLNRRRTSPASATRARTSTTPAPTGVTQLRVQASRCRGRDRPAGARPAPDSSSCPARTPPEGWKQCPCHRQQRRCGHPDRTAQHRPPPGTARPASRTRACPHPYAGSWRSVWNGTPGPREVGRGP